jgi:hypothetical protein
MDGNSKGGRFRFERCGGWLAGWLVGKTVGRMGSGECRLK